MDLQTHAQRLVEQLAAAEKKLVLAESCTAGLVASSLATVPGVSRWLAGSMVVYQEASKVAWLGVATETLEQFTAVSAPVAHQMVTGALKQTPHADIAAAVTGHLGPDAPEGFDGLVFIATAVRGQAPRTHRVELTKQKRIARQNEASIAVIETLSGLLPAPAT